MMPLRTLVAILFAVALLGYSTSRLVAAFRNKVCVTFLGFTYWKGQDKTRYWLALAAHVWISLSIIIGFATMPMSFTGRHYKPAEQRRLESRISALVQRGASAAQVAAALGSPYHTYTREEVLRYLAETPERDGKVRDTWRRFSQYPETLWYRGPPTYGNYIFLDANRKAVACHFTSE